MLHSETIQLPHVLTAEVLEQVAAHQFVPKCHEDAFFHLLAADGSRLLQVPRERAPKHASRSCQ